MSEPKEGTAAHAYQCAETILKGNGKPAWAQKMTEYLYEWNQLMLYLGKKNAEEKRGGHDA